MYHGILIIEAWQPERFTFRRIVFQLSQELWLIKRRDWITYLLFKVFEHCAGRFSMIWLSTDHRHLQRCILGWYVYASIYIPSVLIALSTVIIPDISLRVKITVKHVLQLYGHLRTTSFRIFICFGTIHFASILFILFPLNLAPALWIVYFAFNLFWTYGSHILRLLIHEHLSESNCSLGTFA